MNDLKFGLLDNTRRRQADILNFIDAISFEQPTRTLLPHQSPPSWQYRLHDPYHSGDYRTPALPRGGHLVLCSRVRPVITLATDGQYEETLDFSKSVHHFTDLVRSKDSWT